MCHEGLGVLFVCLLWGIFVLLLGYYFKIIFNLMFVC